MRSTFCQSRIQGGRQSGSQVSKYGSDNGTSNRSSIRSVGVKYECRAHTHGVKKANIAKDRIEMFSRFAHKFHEKFISCHAHTQYTRSRETLNARFSSLLSFWALYAYKHARASVGLMIPGARSSSRSVSKLFAKSHFFLFTSAAAAAANPNFQTGPMIMACIVLLLHRNSVTQFYYNLRHAHTATQRTRKCATNTGTTMTMHAPQNLLYCSMIKQMCTRL